MDLSILAAGSLAYALTFHITERRVPADIIGTNARRLVASNALKAAVLAPLAALFTYMCATYRLRFLAVDEGWVEIRELLCCCCALYTITDLVSLLMLRDRLPASTLAHHLCVVLAYVYVRTADMSRPGIYQPIVMYGGLSSLAGFVNTYLAARKLHIVRHGVSTCIEVPWAPQVFVGYALECAVNWSWQAYYYLGGSARPPTPTDWTGSVQWITESGGKIMYLCMLALWIRDDVKLLRAIARDGLL